MICGTRAGERAVFRSLPVKDGAFNYTHTKPGDTSYTATTALTHVGYITVAQKPVKEKEINIKKETETWCHSARR